MKPRLAVVFLKEIRDALRDRRTALMILVASVLTGPVTLVLVASFVSGLEERDERFDSPKRCCCSNPRCNAARSRLTALHADTRS